VPADRLVRLVEPTATVRDGGLDTVITHVLIFGNVTFAGTPADLEAAIGPLEPGRLLAIDFPATDGRAAVREETTWAVTFGAVPLGASLLMSDSEGQLSLADNQGDAARRIGLTVDRPARITAS
jgi:S-adenosylmethionine hydrolase